MPMQNPSFAQVLTDPLRNFKFEVTFALGNTPALAGLAKMGFMSVSGLNITTELIPYREGGMNTTTQKMPGQTDFAPITLSKGLCLGDSAMTDWVKQIFAVTQGTGGNSGQDFRMDLEIHVKAHPWTGPGIPPTKAAFKVHNAWPQAVAFSDLDAGANAIIVQQMTLAHEGFEVLISNAAGAAEVKF